jgi:AGZA family xanthine/uracil permease-like MFS transporter
MNRPTASLNWWSRGDFDGFVGLFIDNLVQLLVILGLCGGLLEFESSLILERILPGAAISLILGNVLYALQARKVARKLGRDVCALPYGINTPSVFTYIFMVMLPVKFQAVSMGLENPNLVAWKMGVAAAFGSGIIETLGAFVATKIRQVTPRAALLSTLAGIALGFISFGFLYKSYAHPMVGLVTLGVIFIGYFGKIKFPARIPTGLAALIVGVAFCWLGDLRQLDQAPAFETQLYLPIPVFGDLWQVISSGQWLDYSGIIILMGLFNVVGSLQNIESAEAAGDPFPPQSSLLINGLGTLLGAGFGSCFPTTIYIGHPGWKEMGARYGYSILNAVVCTLLCLTGLISLVAFWIPLEAGMAIVVYIGIVISAQAFSSVDKKYYAAVVIGLLPGLGAWGVLMAKSGFRIAGGKFDQAMYDSFNQTDLAIKGGFALEQGFIFTAMITSAFVVALIDKKLIHAGVWMSIAAVLSACGLTHSFALNGADAAMSITPAWPWAKAYTCLAAIVFILAWIQSSKEKPHL